MRHHELLATLSPYDTVVFDLDDTIYPSSLYEQPALYDVARLILQWPHKEALQFVRDAIHLKTTNPDAPLFQTLLAHAALAPTLLEKCVHQYQSHDCRFLQPEHSLSPLIEQLKQKGVQLLLVTNGFFARQQRKIQALHLTPLFDAITIADETPTTASMKPAPDAFHHFCANHAVIRAVMVGDSVTIDGGFADNCGIDFVHFCYPALTGDDHALLPGMYRHHT